MLLFENTNRTNAEANTVKLMSIGFQMVIFFLLFTSNFIPCFSQSPQRPFKITNWRPENEISSVANYAMLKDSTGFLWLTTPDGLLRFDGSTFTTYHSDDKQKTIIGSRTLGLVEDSMHNIWIGSDSGLNRYDTHADSFQTFPMVKPAGIVAGYFIPFWATSKEVWYIDRNVGILAIDIKTWKRKILFRDVPSVYYYNRLTYTFYDSTSKTIWYPGVNSTMLYTLKDGKPYTRPDDGRQNTLAKLQRLLALVNDTTRHCVWFAYAGLNKLDLNSNKIENCGMLSDSSLRVSALCIDSGHRIWIGTRTKGVFVYEPEKGIIQHILYEPGNPNSLQSNQVRSIYCDKDGMVWIGAGTGIDQLSTNLAIHHYSVASSQLTSASVRSFAEDKDKKIWIATMDGGINIYDPAADSFSYLTKKDIPGMGDNRTRSLCMDTVLNKAWIAADFAPGRLELKTKKYKRITFNNTDGKQMDAGSIWPDAWQLLNDSTWIFGSFRGLFVLNKEADTAYQLPFLRDEIITAVAKVHDIIFVSSNDHNTYAYSIKGKDFVYQGKPFGNIQVSAINWDEGSWSWWIGATGGLYHFDKNFVLIKHYTAADGLPDNAVSTILPDKRGFFWIGTNNGLCTFDTVQHQFKDVGVVLGINNSNIGRTSFLASDGAVYFTNAGGFIRIEPAGVRYHFPPAKAYFKSLTIDKKDLSTVNINAAPVIRLKYFQNDMDVETGVLDFYLQGKNKLRYKLMGISNDWKYAAANYHIHYGSLAPGTYKFIMQAANGNGEWNGSQKQITFIIAPPFWQTWWFRIAIVLLMGFIFFEIYTFRVNQLKKVISVRSHISRDLHDEVGSTLSGISIISRMAKQNLQHEKAEAAENLLDKITASSTEMLSKISDIVWAVNPLNDNLEQIVLRLKNDMQPVAISSGVTLFFKIDKSAGTYNLDMQQRQNIYLVCKEAINNALKYAQCKNLSVHFSGSGQRLYITIQDDGKGFDVKQDFEGNGLRNMRSRAAEINAVLKIDAAEGNGTIIHFYINTRMGGK